MPPAVEVWYSNYWMTLKLGTKALSSLGRQLLEVSQCQSLTCNKQQSNFMLCSHSLGWSGGKRAGNGPREQVVKFQESN